MSARAAIPAMILGALALAGCGELTACERLSANVFRDAHQGAQASDLAGFDGVTARLYGGGEGRMTVSDGVIRIFADAPGALQVQRAAEVHYFEILPGSTRVSLDGDDALCERR